MKTPDLIDLFKSMLLIRESEKLIQREYASNTMKTPMHLAIGAEAIPCGILPFFKERRVFGTYRNHHWFLETTKDVEGFFLELLGKQKAACQGRAGSMHLCDPSKGMILTSAVVSTTIPIALGDSWAGQIQNRPEQTIVFFGDAAIEEGVFWETINFSRLKSIPILFVCEDNDLAIHSKKNQRQSFNIKTAVETYKVPYFFADACDVENVVRVTELARESLKNGPVFLHLEYFRAFEHVGIAEDFCFNYREKPNDLYSQKDPVWNCRNKLSLAGYGPKQLDSIEEEIRNQIKGTYTNCLGEVDSQPEFIDKFLFRSEPK